MILNHRPFTTPRVLGGSPKEHSNEEESEEEMEEKKVGNVNDVAKTNRQTNRSHERGVESQDTRNTQKGHGQTAKGNNKTDKGPKRDVKGRGRGQGVAPDVSRNRSYKDRNKATRANHNRKAGADRKRSKGMGALPPQ